MRSIKQICIDQNQFYVVSFNTKVLDLVTNIKVKNKNIIYLYHLNIAFIEQLADPVHFVCLKKIRTFKKIVIV